MSSEHAVFLIRHAATSIAKNQLSISRPLATSTLSRAGQEIEMVPKNYEEANSRRGLEEGRGGGVVTLWRRGLSGLRLSTDTARLVDHDGCRETEEGGAGETEEGLPVLAPQDVSGLASRKGVGGCHALGAVETSSGLASRIEVSRSGGGVPRTGGGASRSEGGGSIRSNPLPSSHSFCGVLDKVLAEGGKGWVGWGRSRYVLALASIGCVLLVVCGVLAGMQFTCFTSFKSTNADASGMRGCWQH